LFLSEVEEGSLLMKWSFLSSPALLLASCLAAAAQTAPTDDGWKQTLDAANKEGEVTISLHLNNALANVAKAFQAKYPSIKVNYSLQNVATFTPKVMTEQRNGEYLWDVLIAPTSNAVSVLAPAGVFQDFVPFVVNPEIRDDKKWHGGFELWGNNLTGLKKVFIFSARLQGGVSVNRDVVRKSDFSTLDQLLDPKWRGKIVLDEPNAPRLGSLTLMAFMKEKGPDFVKQLLTVSQPVISANPRLMTEWFATGRYPIALSERTDILLEFKAAGVVKSTDLIPPSFLADWGVAAFTKAPHPNATRVFVNWFLSQEGQDAFANAVGRDGGISRRVDVESRDPEHTPEWSRLDGYAQPNRERDYPLVKQVIDLYASTKR
jgi:iron(III) transport system substrate-binding protein